MLDNTVLDSTFFLSYLHYLYFREDWDGIETWVGVLSYLKVKPEVEFFVNFSLMVKKIKDVQLGEDDSEDTKELITQLGDYFENECPIDEFKDSAKYIQIMYSKLVAKDKEVMELKAEAQKLVEKNPGKFKELLGKHFD